MKKRILAVVLALAMTLGLCTTAFAAGYTDTEDHWGKASIERWTDYGIVEGSGAQFNPNTPMTRGEVAKVLANLLGLKAEADLTGYTDVPSDQWYHSYMAKCVAAGIFQGVAPDQLAPNAPVSREQMFVLLGRALGLAPKATADKQFADGEQVSDWAQGYVNALADRGIVSGVGGNQVAPLDNINRASVMAVLDKAITTYVNTDGQTVAAEGGIVLVNASNVTVTGAADNVVVASTNSTVSLSGATVTDVAVVGEGNTLSLTNGATAGTVTVSDQADSATVNVAAGSTVSTVTTAADGVTVAGAGTVEKAEIKGNDTTVNTSGTDLTVAEGATGATENGKPVESGATVETKPAPTVPSAPVAVTSAKVRSNGPAEGAEGDNYDYAAAYAEAGINVTSGTNLNGNTVTINTNNLDSSKLTEQMKHDTHYYVGIEFLTQYGAAKAKVTIGESVQTYELNTNSDSVYNGKFIAYFGVADGNKLPLAGTENPWTVKIDWLPETGDEPLGTTTYTVKRERSADAPVLVSDSQDFTALLGNAAVTKIALGADISITPTTATNTAISGRELAIDLNGHNLTFNAGGALMVQKKDAAVTKLTLTNSKENGTLTMNNATGSNSCISVEAGCSVTATNLTIRSTGTVFYPRGSAAAVTVKNCNITTSGAFGIGTNANGPENYGVVITVENTKITMTDPDSCGLLINVAGTMNATNTTVNGTRQAAIVRAGTTTFDGCTFNAVSQQIASENSRASNPNNWTSGNNMSYGALIVGNQAGAYEANATVKLKNCTLSASLAGDNTTPTAEFRTFGLLAVRGNNDYATNVTFEGTNYITGEVATWATTGKTVTLTNCPVSPAHAVTDGTVIPID